MIKVKGDQGRLEIKMRLISSLQFLFSARRLVKTDAILIDFSVKYVLITMNYFVS